MSLRALTPTAIRRMAFASLNNAISRRSFLSVGFMGRDHGIAIRGFKRKRAKGGAQGKCPGAFIVGRADAGSHGVPWVQVRFVAPLMPRASITAPVAGYVLLKRLLKIP